MDLQLKAKVVLITGGAKGIGAKIMAALKEVFGVYREPILF